MLPQEKLLQHQVKKQQLIHQVGYKQYRIRGKKKIKFNHLTFCFFTFSFLVVCYGMSSFKLAFVVLCVYTWKRAAD